MVNLFVGLYLMDDYFKSNIFPLLFEKFLFGRRQLLTNSCKIYMPLYWKKET